LVQSFFAHILTSDLRARARDDKERFRSYLFDTLNYFLADSGGPREGVSKSQLSLLLPKIFPIHFSGAPLR